MPEPAGETKIPCFLHAGTETVMAVTRGGAQVDPVTTFGAADFTTLSPITYTYYVVKPGDVISVTGAGEAKGGVKAGPDVKSDCVDADGVLTHPINVTLAELPVTYTVGEHDTYINVFNKQS